MVADDGLVAASGGARRPEEPLKGAPELGQVGKSPVEVRDLLTHQIENVGRGATAGAPDLDNLLDLVEAEPEPPGLVDERNGGQRLCPVDSITCRGAARRRNEPRALVQAKRFSTHAALRRVGRSGGRLGPMCAW